MPTALGIRGKNMHISRFQRAADSVEGSTLHSASLEGSKTSEYSAGAENTAQREGGTIQCWEKFAFSVITILIENQNC